MADIIDINVSETTENVQITVTPNLTTVNINQVTGGGGNQDLQSVTDLGATTTNQININNTENIGLSSYSPNDVAIFGRSDSESGIQGVSIDGLGVLGVSTNGVGVFGQSQTEASFFGYANGVGSGLEVTSINGNGIIATANGTTIIEGNMGNFSDGLVINSGTSSTGRPIYINKNGVQKLSVNQNGDITANSFIKSGGTSAQFLMADGSTSTGSGGSYVPYTGATSDLNLGTNNLKVNNVFDGFTSITASATLISLTISSTPSYLVTGSGGQIIKMPDATTLPNGAIYNFNNNQSSGTISVNNNSNTLIKSVPSGGNMTLELIDNSTAAGGWDSHFQAPSNVSWSTNTFDYSGSITSATWNGGTIAINRGGTGATTSSAALTNLGAYPNTNPNGYISTVNGTAITPSSTNGVSSTTMAYLDATSSVQTQLNSKQSTSLNAYTLKANNTNTTANATDIVYKSLGIQTYTGTIVWTGTTAPSGVTNHSYNWIQIGNMVTLNLNLIYATAGSLLTAVSMTLPSDCPNPLKPNGLASASQPLYFGVGRISPFLNTTASGSVPYIRTNAANNGFELFVQVAASSALEAQITIQYFI